MIRIEKQDRIATLWLDQPDRSANLLGSELLEAFAVTVDQLVADDDLSGVILTSAKKDFVAGADLTLLAQADSPEEWTQAGMRFKAAARKLETLGVPVVAALNGTALGGGYELSLCTHHRILLDHKGVRVGLPETKLGLFPGGGGASRLPRIIGIQPALEIIMEGRDFKPAGALEAGLVDALADSPEALLDQAQAWLKANPDARQPWDRKGFRWPGGNPRSPQATQMLAIAPSVLNQKTRSNYPNQLNALAAVVEGAMVDIDTAARIETRYFANTVCSQVAKNMMQAFWFQLNAIKRGGSRPADIAPSTVTKVGVLGAGMMGSGIAYVSAMAGLPVVLKDVNQEQAEQGKSYSTKLLAKRVGRGRMTEEQAQGVAALIAPTADAADLTGCDLIIEAVFEDRELKASVTAEAEAQIPENVVFASNTSTLPITGLAERSSRPAQFVGLHFFSPVDKMPLVEIIVGEQTSPETLARAFDFVLQIGKTPIVVNDSRGFYTSRVFSTYVQEGVALLSEGMHPRAIESAGLQAGMPVGPLALSDEVSLSLMYHIKTQTRKDLEAAGQTYHAHPSESVIDAMVTQLDRPGKKAGRGFYDYPTDGPKHLWPGLAQHFPLAENQLSQQDMIDRMMVVQAVETVRCLDEGVLTSVADANIGSIFGWGFAPFQGGTLQFINAMGVAAFVARAEELATTYGERFTPPQRLRDMAQREERF